MISPLPALRTAQAGGGLRLRTLLLIRWLSMAGQVAAVVAANQRFGLDLPLAQCAMVIATAGVANIVARIVYSDARRLPESGAFLMLLFDLSQLSLLLFLTGGMTNPFALMLLAPVVISASALQLRTTVFLALVAISYATLLAITNRPMRYADGRTFDVPPLFEFGFWLSILIGILFLGFYAYRVAAEMRSLGQALLATQMALAREQKLTDLGGVVAATAHELGSPLATIKLVSTELMSELADRPDLRADAALVRDQADRCRDILRSMGRAGKDDQHLRRAPLASVLREAAEPHMTRGKRVEIAARPDGDGSAQQPVILRRPELVHGLRNLIQNAVDYAASTVWIDAQWTGEGIIIAITDDGPGFPGHVLARIGEPFLRDRAGRSAAAGGRPEYEGMGLGLFIAKTLLERTGGALAFSNAENIGSREPAGRSKSGAVIAVAWRRADLEAAEFLGQNQPYEP